MNRLQKKCFIASTSVHLLLVVVLLIGSAFVANRPSQSVPLITFVPFKTVDEPVSGGGNPNAAPPAALTALPPTPVVPQPPTPSSEVKPPKNDPPPADTGKHQVVPNLKLTARNPNTATPSSRTSNSRTADDDARRRTAEQIGQTIRGIRSGLSSGTSIELKGPGGGGVPYANWLQAVKKAYSDAWILPDGINDDSATVTVSVTIGRNGNVISSRITDRSGNATVDHSVQMTLDRVRFAAPLPDNSTDEQRTVIIDFNVKAKLLG